MTYADGFSKIFLEKVLHFKMDLFIFFYPKLKVALKRDFPTFGPSLPGIPGGPRGPRSP